MDDFFRRARPRHRPVNDDTQSDSGVLDIDEEICESCFDLL